MFRLRAVRRFLRSRSFLAPAPKPLFLVRPAAWATAAPRGPIVAVGCIPAFMG